jgi:hypothetical protein
MGAFYYSIHIKTDDFDLVHDAVKSVAKKTKCCLVSPVRKGWISIYPEHFEGFEKTVKLISSKIDLPLLAVFLYDSDMLNSTIYQNGKVVDSYSSHPGYFQKIEHHVAQKYHGKPEKYALFLNSSEKVHRLGELFDVMRGAVLCTTDLLDQFTKLLNLTDVWTSYGYLQDFEETDGIEQWKHFVHLPPLSAKIQKQKKAEAVFQRELDILKDQGILKKIIELLAAKNDPKVKVHWTSTSPNNLLLVEADWNNHSSLDEFENKPLLRLSKPWVGEPTPLGIETKPYLFSVYGSPSGQYAAIMNCNPHFLEIYDLFHQSLLGKVSLNGTFALVYFLSDEKYLLAFTNTRDSQIGWLLINITDGKVIKTGNATNPTGSGTVVAAIHSSNEWLALGFPGEILIENIVTAQTLAIPVGAAIDMTSAIAPQIRDTINEVEADPELKKSINDEWKKQFQEFASRSFIMREHVYSLAFCNQFLCCGTNVGVRAYPWEAIMTSKTGECSPRFAHLREDQCVTDLNEIVMGICPDPKRNRLLFGQGRKLFSMNLTDGKVTTLITLPTAARIMRIASLGETTFALEVGVSFPHYGRNTHPKYLYIVELEQGKLQEQ